jgi:hypothetical protein
MTIRPTFRRVVLTLPDTTIKPSTVPLTPPALEDRLSPGDCDSALRQGLVPVPVQHGHIAPIFPKHHHLARLEAEYRVHLRHAISKGLWTPDAPVNEQLLWGYQQRLAEYEAKDELEALSNAYRTAAKVADDLRLKLQADGRLFEGIALPVAIEANLKECDAHFQTLQAARDAGTMTASSALQSLAWQDWLSWLFEKRAWEILAPVEGGTQERYRLDRVSMGDLERMAGVFRTVADLAEWVRTTGTNAVMQRPPRGGHPIDYPMKWLILEARRQGIDVAALGKLIYERRNDLANFRGLSKATLTKRINEAWRRVPQSDPSLQTPTVAHNL